MSALNYAVNEIRNQIPEDLLIQGLLIDEPMSTSNLTSIDDKLMTKVLRKRVLMDTNLVGGMEMIIPLNTTPPMHSEDHLTVYRIDKELTMGREIVSALGLAPITLRTGFGSYGHVSNASGINALDSVTDRVGDSFSPSGNIHNAHLELIGPNTILVKLNYISLSSLGVRVVVENESNMNNIQPRSWKDLSYLCVLATKAYLYNKLIIPVNSGLLVSGQDLGIFKSILESYDGAEEEYRIYLQEVWSKVAFMNDTGRYNRFLGSMIAPDL